MAHHLSGIHRFNEAPIKNAAGEGRVSFFSNLAFQIFLRYLINPEAGHSEQSEESLPRQPRRQKLHFAQVGESRTVRKLLDLLYQSEIGKPANFSDLCLS
jgi:hypothetical protein